VPASDLGKKRHNGDAGGTSNHPSGFGDAGAGPRGRARTGAAGADVAAARRARVGVVEPILVAQGLCLQFVRYRDGDVSMAGDGWERLLTLARLKAYFWLQDAGSTSWTS